jgi:lipopolysaccharide export LptBFGC system permease protein LptF
VLIQLYVLRQLLVSIAFSVAGLAVIVLPTVAIQAVNKLGAISVGMVARYLPLVVAELVPYLLPMAFLLGVVATYGRLAAERELIAINMAGIHPFKLTLPALLVALPLSFGTDRLLGEISPELKYQQRSLLRDADVSRFLAGMSGRNLLTFGKNVLKSESTEGSVRKNAELDMELEDGKHIKILAAEARIEVEGDYLVVRMKDMRFLTDKMSSFGANPTYSWKLSEIFPPQKKDKSNSKYRTNSDLSDALQDETLAPALRDEYRYEIQRRHALAATYLLFLLLGLPTGVVLRSSTQLGAFTGAVGYAFLYYVLAMRLGKVLAETGVIAPFVAAWATNALFLAVGLVFFVRAILR